MWYRKRSGGLQLLSSAFQRHITANATEELKIDGWRALAVVEDGNCTLMSRHGNAFRRFEDLRTDLAKRLPSGTVLDGEICCLDAVGRPQFYQLMRRNPDCYFYAFDVLCITGEDLRALPLVERKARLRQLIR